MDDMEKLRLLLPHWLVHNAEHAAEFRTWAGRMEQAGQKQLAARIESAARKLEAVSQELEAAVRDLGHSAGDSPSDSGPHGDHAHQPRP